LRAVRKAQGHSLATVSRATNISTSFLSLVETGRSDITLGRLNRLVSFYNIHISDLLPKPTPEHPGVVRAANQTLLHRSSSEGIAIYLLAPDMDRKLMPIMVVVEPGGHTYEPTSYEGEEFIHVTEGVLSVLLGDEDLLLHPGDTVYYDSSVPHSISNPGQSACRFFATVTPPHF
jgi:quercetin dioxygenase-like cupin family protein